MTIELGRLATVAPREVWPHEAHDFTPWLLANVDVLSDLLGMDLELTAAEHPVGNFSLDLIGQDTSTGERVIVENQLEVSDHTHLGQIITYAAGTDPTTIVWITTGFRPEHRAAIDWLNERTDENTRIFGVVINVVRIGDSPVAPNFELVAQPNDWEKAVRRSATAGESGERPQLYREFWEQALSWFKEQGVAWAPRGSTLSSAYCDTSTGIAGVVVPMGFRRGGLSVQVYFNSADGELNAARFAAMFARRTDFEAAVGAEIEWDAMEGLKGARVALAAPFGDVAERDQWAQMNAWIVRAQESMRRGLQAIEAPALFEVTGDISGR